MKNENMRAVQHITVHNIYKNENENITSVNKHKISLPPYGRSIISYYWFAKYSFELDKTKSGENTIQKNILFCFAYIHRNFLF